MLCPPNAPRVLLAEDDAEFRSLLAIALRGWGLSVRVATSGFDLSWALFGREELPNLVVTDVRMPGPSGLENLRDMRNEGWATPVILLTAFPDDALRLAARKLGARVLEKPFGMPQLQRAIASALAS